MYKDIGTTIKTLDRKELTLQGKTGVGNLSCFLVPLSYIEHYLSCFQKSSVCFQFALSLKCRYLNKLGFVSSLHTEILTQDETT